MATDFHSPAISWQTPRIATHGNSGFSLLAMVANWYARACQRQQLERLSDHMLADIGLTREEVTFESSKPFWLR